MSDLRLHPDEIIKRLLTATGVEGLCILDSCRVGKTGANRFFAGVDPVRTARWAGDDPERTLAEFKNLIDTDEFASVFTISYDFGNALQNIRTSKSVPAPEPDVFLAQFDSLLYYDYEMGTTETIGAGPSVKILESLSDQQPHGPAPFFDGDTPAVRSNLTQAEYLNLIDQVKEMIRSGQTYQTNITQQLEIGVPEGASALSIFHNLRRRNPAPYAAYIDRGDSYVVSTSPESFFTVTNASPGRFISTSPIKGTRPRGSTSEEDARLRQELAQSEKDRAENTMIVDLMRNDLGRICEFGTVGVTGLCSVEAHPTLFQLVSTVQGKLASDAGYADIIRALFPCGSITGAPKLRTMEIIDRLEPDTRGLSMGAIGCRIPRSFNRSEEIFEASVAIRTMVIRNGSAKFNVGGGVVIDSDPRSEHAESMLKAKALLEALGVSPQN